MAYLRTATHPRIFERPLDPSVARANLDAFVSRQHVRCPGEGDRFWPAFQDVVTGNISAATSFRTRTSPR